MCFLYEDRITAGDQVVMMGQCILRRTNQGFRLTNSKGSEDFSTKYYEEAEKWFTILKKFSIQPNFSREFKLLQRLSYLNQGQIFSARRISNQQLYNVCVIEKNKKLNTASLMQEINILKRIKHKYIMNQIEIYEDSQNLYQVFTTYIGCELSFRYEELLHSSESTIAKILYRLLDAVAYLHSLNIVHGYLALENIYIRSDNVCDLCITNFNHAEFFGGKQIKGVIGYQSPELLSGNYNQSIDVYALGVIFFYLIYQEMPYSEFNDHVLIINIQNDNKTGYIKYSQHNYSAQLTQLMQLMLAPDPLNRISALEALSHPWFITMKMEEKLNKNKKKLLPTIIEKSDIFQMSPMMKRCKNNFESIGVFEDEFINESISDKLSQLDNSFIPSKSNHDKMKTQ